MGIETTTAILGAQVVAGGAEAAMGFAGGAAGGDLNAARADRRRFETEARFARTAAIQTEAGRRQELGRALGTITAFRAARGLDVGSPGSMAIRRGVQADAEIDIAIERLNMQRRAQGLDEMGRLAEQEGVNERKRSRIAGITSGIGSLLDTASFASGGFGGGGGGYGGTGGGKLIRSSKTGMLGGGV